MVIRHHGHFFQLSNLVAFVPKGSGRVPLALGYDKI